MIGEWIVIGCCLGFVQLCCQGSSYIEEIFFSYLGCWLGYLFQLDCDYGFYYEMNLLVDGIGILKIVSEDVGGEVLYVLCWKEIINGIIFMEDYVIEKIDLKWKWCLKLG